MQIFKATNPPGTAFNNQDDDDDGSDDILLHTYNVPIVVPNGLNISLHLNLLAWYDLHFPFYKSKKKKMRLTAIQQLAQCLLIFFLVTPFIFTPPPHSHHAQ